MNLKIVESIPFSRLTTFKTGGEAKYIAEVNSHEDLRSAVKFAEEKKLPVFVLGGGSDILVSDNDFNGLVVRFLGNKIVFKKDKSTSLVTAEAGMVWDDLVKSTVENNLQGIECLSGIPGNVGAAPIQNIGAYGQELKDVFVSLTAYDLKQKDFIIFSKKDCKFGYRESIFKKPEVKGRYIITDITLRLCENCQPRITYQSLYDYLININIQNPNLSQVRSAVLDIRGKKLEDPKVLGNAGSFFKNPIVSKDVLKSIQKLYPGIPFYPHNTKMKLFAGWLIEQTGWKGKKYKNAAVSERNALVLVNPEGKATTQEIWELAQKITADVYKKFNIKLEPEVQYIEFK